MCRNGIDYECKIKSISDEVVTLDVVSEKPCSAEPTINLTLYQAIPKLDKFETIIQKSVELGVTRIVPVQPLSVKKLAVNWTAQAWQTLAAQVRFV